MADTLITFDGGTLWNPVVAGQNGILSTPDAYTPYFGYGYPVEANVGVWAGDAANTVDSRFRVELGMTGNHYGSIFMRNPVRQANSYVVFFSWLTAGNSILASLRANFDGGFNIRVGTSTIVRTGTAGELPVDQWFRFDWQLTGDTINWRLFLDPAAAANSTPSYSGTFNLASGAGATVARLVMGPSASQSVVKYWGFDTIRVTNTGTWFGPYGATPPTGPTVKVWNGTAEVNATVSVWNGTAEVPASLASII